MGGARLIVLPGDPAASIDVRRNVRGAECGAAGALVVLDGQPGFLTCNHVAAWNGHIPTGSPVGIRCADGSIRGVGTLAGFDRLDDSVEALNRTDSALVLLAPGVEARLEFGKLGPGEPVCYEVDEPRLGSRVIKYGPSSGVTRGRIAALDHAPRVHHVFGSYRFVDQILIEGEDGRPFAAKGDSGALVLSDDPGQPRRPIGLIWGGRERWAHASRLDLCLRRLGVRLLDQEAGGVP